MKDIRQSKNYANYLEKTGWQVEKKDGVYYYIKKIPVIGSVLKIQRPEKLDFQYIKRLIKKHGVFQVIIEPKDNLQVNALKNQKYLLSKSPYLPSKTLHLNLQSNKQNLIKSFDKDVSYSLRKTKDIKILFIENLASFRNSWKEAVGLKRHVPSENKLKSLAESFKKNCLFLTTPAGESGAIFLKTKDTAYYWQAFSSRKGRKRLAQYKILWTGILWSKKEGAKIFDFEGIYDERFPQKSWVGFSKFKKKFAGKEIVYPGAYAKIILIR